MSPSNDLLSGNIIKRLSLMTGPVIIGLVSVRLIQVTDAYFVSKLGHSAAALISLTFPVALIAMGVMVGLGIAASVHLSRYIGAADVVQANRLVNNALGFSILLSLPIALALFLLAQPVYAFLGVKSEYLGLMRHYMAVWGLGFCLLSVVLVGNALIRATGNTKLPSTIMVTAAVVNMGFDPIFIFGLRLGEFVVVEPQGFIGAAWASVLARLISLVICIICLHRIFPAVRFSIPSASDISWLIKLLNPIALPSIGNYLLPPVTIAIILKLAAPLGEQAVAAIGIGSRLQQLLYIVPSAFGIALTTFVAQNLGAEATERARKSYWYTVQTVVLYGLLLGSILFVKPDLLTVFFSENAYLSQFIQWTAISLPFFAASIISLAVFNAHRRSRQGFKINLMMNSLLLFTALVISLVFSDSHLYSGLILTLIVIDILFSLTSGWFAKGLFTVSSKTGPKN